MHEQLSHPHTGKQPRKSKKEALKEKKRSKMAELRDSQVADIDT